MDAFKTPVTAWDQLFVLKLISLCAFVAAAALLQVPRNSRPGLHRCELYFSPLNGAKQWLPMPSQLLLAISRSRHSYQHHKPKQVPTVGAFLFFDHPLASCAMFVRIRRNDAVLRHRMWDRKVPLFDSRIKLAQSPLLDGPPLMCKPCRSPPIQRSQCRYAWNRWRAAVRVSRGR